MVQLIVVVSSIVLGMMLYPKLIGIYNRFVTKLYKNIEGDKNEKTEKMTGKAEEIPSIIGKSKFNLSQSTPTTAANPETEKVIEKEDTFVPSADEKTEPMEVDVPLEKVEALSQEEFDSEEEEMELEVGKDAVCASGASFDELIDTGHVITHQDVSEEREIEAGRVLSQNQKTDMFEQLASGNQAIQLRVISLIQLHEAEYEKERKQNQGEIVDYENDSDEFANFDTNILF